MSGIQPVTMPNPIKVIKTCMWLWCKGAVGCKRCCAMSLAPSSCCQACGRYHRTQHSRSDQPARHRHAHHVHRHLAQGSISRAARCLEEQSSLEYSEALLHGGARDLWPPEFQEVGPDSLGTITAVQRKCSHSSSTGLCRRPTGHL
jgi:hypothetical protein